MASLSKAVLDNLLQGVDLNLAFIWFSESLCPSLNSYVIKYVKSPGFYDLAVGCSKNEALTSQTPVIPVTLVDFPGEEEKLYLTMVRSRSSAVEVVFKNQEHFDYMLSEFCKTGPVSVHGEADRHCAVCHKQTRNKCKGCKSTSYCSKECQVAHRPRHKRMCRDVHQMLMSEKFHRYKRTKPTPAQAADVSDVFNRLSV